MSELPGRPDLDQLRRQARELLRAAVGGDSDALARLRAVSGRVTLSAAQLALAREYGCASWPALRAEAQHRRAQAYAWARYAGTDGPGHPGGWEERRSFGAEAATIETAAGLLSLRALVTGRGHAALDASLSLAGQSERGFDERGQGLDRVVRAEAVFAGMIAGREPGFDDVVVSDDQGVRYRLRVAAMQAGQGREPAWLRLELDPVPRDACGWLELAGGDGTRTRLLPSARAAVRVGRVAPPAQSRAEWELGQLAVSLMGLRLSGADEDGVKRRCSSVLARLARLRGDGGLEAGGQLPGQVAALCAHLAGQRATTGLPAAWSGVLEAAGRTDGTRLHLDTATAVPRIGESTVCLDSLVCAPDSWCSYLRAAPGWFIHSADQHYKRAAMEVHAEDDLGGMYLSSFGASTTHRDHEEVTIRFLPRLDPRARAVKLVFTGAAGETVAVEVRLAPASASESQRTRSQSPPTLPT
jgi:hypothetical protein